MDNHNDRNCDICSCCLPKDENTTICDRCAETLDKVEQAARKEGIREGLRMAVEVVENYEGFCILAGDTGQATGAMYSAKRIKEVLESLRKD